MPMPTFVVCGSQKAGTSTLHDMLGQHPDVFVSRPKELHYFDVHYGRGAEWYAGNFRPAPSQRAWGETTPGYLYKSWARKRMCRDLPEARFLVILRDPVERAYSHYWMNRSQGLEEESFEDALRLEDSRRRSLPRQRAAKVAYLDRGRYVDQLRSLTRLHDRELVTVMLMTDLLSDPAGQMARLFDFLELDPSPAADVVTTQRNSYRRSVLSWRRKASAYPPMDPETDARLREHFRGPNQQLARWLDRDLSGWDVPVTARVD